MSWIVENLVQELILECKIENAKTMLADNMPHEAVAKYSGLSIEEVEELANEMSQ